MDLETIILVYRQKKQQVSKHLSAAERIFKQRYGRQAQQNDMDEVYSIYNVLEDVYGKEKGDSNSR